MQVSTEHFQRKQIHLDYIQKQVDYYCQLHPEADRQQVIKIIATKTLTTLKKDPLQVTIDGTPMAFTDVDKTIVESGLIVTGKGNLYQNHHNAKNLAAEMIQYLLDERSVLKKKMFESMRNNEQSLVDMYNTGQKTVKVLNNSYFGASIEKNSIFFDPYTGDSILSSGRDVITVSVNIFEKWLANNIYFRTVDDCLIYARDVYDDYRRGFSSHGITFKQMKSSSSVVEYLLSKVDSYTDATKTQITKYISTLPPEVVNLIYYKNNLLAFFRDSNVVPDFMGNLLGRLDFKDPNEVPEDLQGDMSKLWDIIHEYVFHNHQDYYRYRNMERLRKAVLVIDTDSNFLYLNPALEVLAELAPDKVDIKNDESTVATINIVMYLATNVINETYTRYGIEVGIPEEYTGRINMKNEFLLKTLMTTEGKKMYASIVLMQEGTIYTEPKVDIKGLAIKKVNTNKKVRKIITDIMEEEILQPDVINISKIIQKYRLLEEDIKTSLEQGDCTYALPASVNHPSTYENPLSNKPLRGILLWNFLYPAEEITFPAKVDMINLKLNLETLAADSTLPEELKMKFREVLNNSNMVIDNEITVISLPKGSKKIPDIFLPFIETTSMIGANLSPGMPILNSAGGTILTGQNNIDISTNVIRM